jgi:hypothetical protein
MQFAPRFHSHCASSCAGLTMCASSGTDGIETGLRDSAMLLETSASVQWVARDGGDAVVLARCRC